MTLEGKKFIKVLTIAFYLVLLYQKVNFQIEIQIDSMIFSLFCITAVLLNIKVIQINIIFLHGDRLLPT